MEPGEVSTNPPPFCRVKLVALVGTLAEVWLDFWGFHTYTWDVLGGYINSLQCSLEHITIHI